MNDDHLSALRRDYENAIKSGEQGLLNAARALSDDRLFPRLRLAFAEAENAVRWLVEAERLAKAIEESEKEE